LLFPCNPLTRNLRRARACGWYDNVHGHRISGKHFIRDTHCNSDTLHQ
jgi:hypothetical protein